MGIRQPGEYKFNTGDYELMQIISGDLEVALAGGAGVKAMKAGETFEVPANGKFHMVVKTLTDYCCSFIAS